MEEKPLILVADDNEDMRMLVSMILSKSGFQIEVAESGRAALDKLEAGLAPDLILSDVMMPEMDGYTFFQHVQKRPEWRRIPFIFFTMKDSVDDIQKGKELGVDDYITKPIMPDALVATVRGKLRRFKQLAES